MSAKVFLDTNVFVYEIDSKAAKVKRQIAHELILDALKERRSVVSYQVIQEFLNVVTGKFSSLISASDAQQYVNAVFEPLTVVQSSIELFGEALGIHTRYQLSWYDSLIVAAASEANCTVLYSEDLQHGAKINGVRIENPFRAGR
ncbi:MAG TPA: PIN domain-containing protein [Bryobacteraceae bacterium]|jgi:predicted nucleic acid-binding protein|nr:PIN domain-containing protein [Bryobacteraceae bacterium]